ncbi:hypothetical protein [Rhizobium johnstonii]|uniref:hypothetical protein n=1 Tax=Rhizobium johnstonii TaxID=3019933 RepID=UPI003F993ECA
MLRRDILGIAVSTPIATIPIIRHRQMSTLLSDIERAAKEEIPGVARVQVIYDPNDKKIPLMIVAYRI